MSDTDFITKPERALGPWLMRSLNLLLNLAALVAWGYLGVWIQKNVPSKTDFTEMQAKLNADLKELQDKVNSMDRTVLQLSETNKRIEDFEQRIRLLERSTTGRRYTP